MSRNTQINRFIEAGPRLTEPRQHYRRSNKIIPEKKYILKKQLKIDALVAAVERYNEQQVNQVTTLDPDPTAVEAGIQDTEYGDEEDSDLELY